MTCSKTMSSKTRPLKRDRGCQMTIFCLSLAYLAFLLAVYPPRVLNIFMRFTGLTRSRSPPPRERIAYRGRNTPPHMAREPVTNGDAPPLRSYTDRATREDKPSEPWNITLRDRRGPKTLPSDTTAPLRRAPDSEPRAPRRNWSPPRTLAEENAAKRRRVEERTADSSYTRRVRSPSPADHLRSSYSSDIREESSRGYSTYISCARTLASTLSYHLVGMPTLLSFFFYRLQERQAEA